MPNVLPSTTPIRDYIEHFINPWVDAMAGNEASIDVHKTGIIVSDMWNDFFNE